MSGYTYLASPYSHPDPEVREARYRAVCEAAAKRMTLMGDIVFSPIAHSHPIEVLGIKEVKSGAFWKRQDMPLLRHADRLAVLKLPGWELSQGLAWEIETAKSLNIPVEYIDP